MWRSTKDRKAAEKPQPPPPAPAPPAVRLGWARDLWMRDPSISVTGERGMIKRLVERFGAAASTDSLYEIWGKCRAEIERKKATDRSRSDLDGLRTPLVDLAPALAGVSAAAPPDAPPPIVKAPPRLDDPARVEPAALVVPPAAPAPARELVAKFSAAKEVVDRIGRYWTNVTDSWSKEEHETIVRLIRSGVPHDEIQIRLAAATGVWRKAGAIMLRVRPLDHDVPGAAAFGSHMQRAARERNKLREALAISEAELVLRDDLSSLPPYVTTETAESLIGNMGRIRYGVTTTFVDVETDSVVWPRDLVVELHRRVVSTFGRVSDRPLPSPPKNTDRELEESIVRQVTDRPGVALGSLSGGVASRVAAAVDRLAAAGLVAKVPPPSGRAGFVVGPAGWTPPPRPAPAPRAPRPAPVERAAPTATDAASPDDGTDGAVADVYRALRAKEIDAGMAAEMIRELRKGS